jgi:peptidoglycan/LPS O-acetylase OafA/YrhL
MLSDFSSFQSRRLVFVDVLRGFACLWVTLCHAHASWLDLYKTQPGDSFFTSILMRTVGIGGKGVELFIVISGFCLLYPVLERVEKARSSLPLTQFYRRRAMRILPTYYAAVLFAFILAVVPFFPHIAPYSGWPDLLLYAAFFQNNVPHHIAGLNGTLWSVALEVQLYLLFPLLVLIQQRYGIVSLLTLAAVCSVLAVIFNDRGTLAQSWINPLTHHAMPCLSTWFSLPLGWQLRSRSDDRVSY